jgi:hypothetical protein
MGSFFSPRPARPIAPVMPAPPPPPPPPPPLPTPVDESVRRVREVTRRRAHAAGGRQSTVATSAQGLSSEAQGTKKTLLGA